MNDSNTDLLRIGHTDDFVSEDIDEDGEKLAPHTLPRTDKNAALDSLGLPPLVGPSPLSDLNMDNTVKSEKEIDLDSSDSSGDKKGDLT